MKENLKEEQNTEMVENAASFDKQPNNMSGQAKREEVVYLNNAGQAWFSPEVEEVGRKQVSLPPWEVRGDEDQKKIRQLFATLIEGDSKNIAMMPSTAFAITFAAQNVKKMMLEERKQQGQKSRNKILVISDQFDSAIYPWQELCGEGLGSLKIVPFPKSGEDWTAMIAEALSDDDIFVVCLPPLHWSDGALIDLKQIGLLCREKNIILVVDATQAVGIMPCSIKEIRPHVLACSVHKWLRGPSGASLVYVSPDLHGSWQPLDQHGRSRDFAEGSAWDASKNAMGPNGYPEKFFSDARKFDSGGKPNPIILPMLRTSMEGVVQNVDLKTSQEKLKELTKPLVEWAMENSFSLSPGAHAWHLIGLSPSFLTPQQMLDIDGKLQNEHSVFIAVRCGCFRVSPYLDTTPEEIARFIKVLSALIQTHKS